MEDHVTKENHYIGMEVVRGRDWKWNVQDGFAGNIGIIVKKAYKGSEDQYWARVDWKNDGEKNNVYRIGLDSFDLDIPNNTYELW